MFTTASGNTQYFLVQDDVTTYQFQVNGAGGGKSTKRDPGNGGGCGIVTATYTIDPTVTRSFMIVLGGAGGAGGNGDGGGLTQVLSCSDSKGQNVDGAVNIIAGGGGGGGFGNGNNGGYGLGVPGAQGSYPGDNAPGNGDGGVKDSGASGGSYPGGPGSTGEHSTGGSSASSTGVTPSSNGGFNGGGQGGIDPNGGGGGGGGFGGGGGGGKDDAGSGSGGGAGGSTAGVGSLTPSDVSYSSAGLNSGDGSVIVSWTLPTPSITYPAGPFNFPIGVLITPIPVSSLVGVLPSQLSLNNAFPPGLNLDNSGNIYGTPTSLTSSTNNSFVVISNIINNGLTVVSNSITINVIGPSITYPSGPFTFTVGDLLQGFPTPDPTATYPEIPVTLVLVQSSTLNVGNVFPTGLIIDPITGNITGTPTVITSSNQYYVTGKDQNGATIVSNNITITIVSPATISYAASDVTTLGSLQVGVALPPNGIIPILDPAEGGMINVSPALSTIGLNFNTSTGVISGTPTVATSGTVFTFTYVVDGQSSLPFPINIVVAPSLVIPPPVNHCNHGINFSLSCTTVNIYNH
jgi:hypothetical protein